MGEILIPLQSKAMVNIPFAARFYHVHMHAVHSKKASCYFILLQIYCLSICETHICYILCSSNSSSIKGEIGPGIIPVE